jgi:hypothetical protein
LAIYRSDELFFSNIFYFNKSIIYSLIQWDKKQEWNGKEMLLNVHYVLSKANRDNEFMIMTGYVVRESQERHIAYSSRTFL